ncbi:MAG: hypothetical protein COU22_02770 [Candidatus Komeilibacteria bacterium CG10_big_fil_rev_8_21_14_0_10_41_13]|uniref:DUF4870 domain-containing protein n=1 Tax=Candidatus Komeilibacteria bacterium CG10_big_fil_rev_8_21_14_0_10_41_13 TaxID=1974476 RepID=A0A2M6WC39_9BACT|nr:MAG: hypothetical protein COU22_02770 [Candidatus Komeilibacteria bacterium CG10_big_fil_rev_8_21_14_0_10_41_13]
MTNELNRDVEENKILAAVSYIWILCLVPLFLKRKSKFVQFHAKQGLVLFIIEIIGWLVFWIPLIGWILFVYVIIMAVMGIMNAMQGRMWEMPILGKYARKINL